MRPAIAVLMIDDDDDDKEMFAEVVSNLNTTVTFTSTSTAQEALELLPNQLNLPDFIFLDLNMPRMNGKQFLVQIKKIEKLASIPVIIYSTSKSAEDREETLNLGAIHFITKPSSMKVLKKELEDVFKKKYEKSA